MIYFQNNLSTKSKSTALMGNDFLWHFSDPFPSGRHEIKLWLETPSLPTFLETYSSPRFNKYWTLENIQNTSRIFSILCTSTINNIVKKNKSISHSLNPKRSARSIKLFERHCLLHKLS